MPELTTKEIVLEGKSICQGVAIGMPFFYSRPHVAVCEMKISNLQMKEEIDRYRCALSHSREDLKNLQKQLEEELAAEGVLILEAQLQMLQDPLLTSEVEKEIKKNKRNAEFVFEKTLLKLQARFKAINDAFFAERFQDLQDLSYRIFGYLRQTKELSLHDLPPFSIVCAEELTATDTASAQSQMVGAFITNVGGATSHAAIVAKAKGIPYVAGICLETLKAAVAHQIIVDGSAGRVIVNPTEETIRAYESLQASMRDQFKGLKRIVGWPAETFDGYRLRLRANVDSPEEAHLVHELGGEGIGLFRSEYIFFPHRALPSEAEQCAIYKKLIKEMQGLPVVIRTFDICPDKPHAAPFAPLEKSPSFNFRGSRFLLKEKKMLQTQLKAIVRASVDEHVSILFPMISTLFELKEAKRLLEEVRQELQLFHPIRIGCMIEVPSAAMAAHELAKECDFLSIGTNDLAQYFFAIDRSESSYSQMGDVVDPSLIQLMQLTVQGAGKAKVPVSVCGEMASDPRFTALLIGLGIQELSVASRFLPVIKAAIRKTSVLEAVKLAEEALSLRSSQEVFSRILEDYRKKFPEFIY